MDGAGARFSVLERSCTSSWLSKRIYQQSELAGAGGNESFSRLFTYLKLSTFYIYHQSRRPIGLNKTPLGECGNYGEINESSISSDGFGFVSLHQVLHVPHHFRKMAVTGEKFTGGWSNLPPFHPAPRQNNKVHCLR
jgi:hypothetical protein